MLEIDVSKRERCRREVFVESTTHIVYLLVDLEQIEISHDSLLNQCNSAKSRIDIVVTYYCCEKGKDVG